MTRKARARAAGNGSGHVITRADLKPSRELSASALLEQARRSAEHTGLTTEQEAMLARMAARRKKLAG